MKEQVSEAVVLRLQIRCSWKFCKFYRKTSVLDSLFNKAAGLKACNPIKERLQHRCFPMKFEKFLRTPFFTKEFQWLHLRFNPCFQRSSEQKPVRLSAINISFSWKKVFAAAKIQKQPPQVFCKRRASRASVFSCEYCEIFKNTYLEKYLWTAVSKNQHLSDKFTKGR